MAVLFMGMVWIRCGMVTYGYDPLTMDIALWFGFGLGMDRVSHFNVCVRKM